MEIKIKIPTVSRVINKGISLKVVGENEKWSQSSLGDAAKKSGVYIHHADGKILYVGQTSKNNTWGTFQIRLRRECQPKAANYSDLYKLLYHNARKVKTTMYHFDEIKKMFSGSLKKNLTPVNMTLILEQFMIAMYRPIMNKK